MRSVDVRTEHPIRETACGLSLLKVTHFISPYKIRLCLSRSFYGVKIASDGDFSIDTCSKNPSLFEKSITFILLF